MSWSVWIGILLVAGMLSLALVLLKIKSQLPAPPVLPVISEVPAFTLTNQFGQPVTLDTLKGHVWVADVIFTRCAGPCPVMTGHMRELQDALPVDSQARLVSLTTDATYDTPPVLARYAERFGAKSDHWNFLTGDPADIARLASKGLKLAAVPKGIEEQTTPEDLFVHSTIFVIVDKQGKLRGSFQTQGEMVTWGRTQQQLLAAIKILESEP